MFKEVLEYLVKLVVENPDQVVVEVKEDAEIVTLRLQVGPSDLGRVIGKEGRTARAMRTLLHAAAARVGRRVRMEILE